MSLDIKQEVVNDALRNLDSNDKRTIEVSGTINPDTLRAEGSVPVGKGWNLRAFIQRLRKAKRTEGGFSITKDV